MISKKLLTVLAADTLIMTILLMVLKSNPEVLTENVLLTSIGGILGMHILYGFQNVVNNFIKSKWFSLERLQSDIK